MESVEEMPPVENEAHDEVIDQQELITSDITTCSIEAYNSILDLVEQQRDELDDLRGRLRVLEKAVQESLDILVSTELTTLQSHVEVSRILDGVKPIRR
ncbi:MAG: hypothetical protein AAF493_18080 [Pseudomonadota bacterium]